jgi:hypothetical protein
VRYAVVPHLEAVQAVQVHAGERLEPRPQEAHRTGRDDRHPGHDGRQIAENGQHGGLRLGRFRVVGDRGQHTVEVEEEGGFLGTLGGEAPCLNGIRGVVGARVFSHDFQTTRSDTRFRYVKCFPVPVRRGASVRTTAGGS